MSFFAAILDRLNLRQPAAATPAAEILPTATAPAAAEPGTPAALSTVDVMARLEAMAARAPQPLNWKTSIVDLLKLLELDSSFSARQAMATELGCPPALMNDSAQMNLWLHKKILQRIAEHGGNIPAELLH